MEFLSLEHEQKFLEFMARAGARSGDRERKALFYILAGDEELACKINRLYDFEDGGITPEARVDLSSGQAALVRVAYNLYNPNQPANLCGVPSAYEEFVSIRNRFKNFAVILYI